jgi:hypothetical protein
MGTSAAPCTAAGSGNRIQRVSRTVPAKAKQGKKSAFQFKYRLNTTISESMQWFHDHRQDHG